MTLLKTVERNLVHMFRPKALGLDRPVLPFHENIDFQHFDTTLLALRRLPLLAVLQQRPSSIYLLIFLESFLAM